MFLSTIDLSKQAWHDIWRRVSLCQQLDWSVYLLLYIFQTRPSICTYLPVTCHNSFRVNIMRVTTTLTPLWEVHIAFSRLQIGFASTRKVQWPIFSSSLSYLVFQSIVLLAKTWRGHLEIGSRNNNSRCLASQHLQNSSYLFFSRVVCILDCFPCTLIELNYQKKVKKPNLVSFLEMDSIRKMKYCYLMSLFMWTCENLKSLFFHIFSTWKICEGIFSLRYFPCWCISSFLLYRTPILRHFLRRQCKQRSLKIQNGVFLSLSIHPRRCEWLSPQFPLCGRTVFL